MFEEQIVEKERISGYQESQPYKRTYTTEDIMDILSIGKNSAYALIKKNEFRSVRIGNRIRISRKSFDEWLDNREGKE